MTHIWLPLKSFGLISSFWSINLMTLLYTGIASLVLFVGAFFIRKKLEDQDSLVSYSVAYIADGLYDMVYDAVGSVSVDVFCFAASLFCIVLFYNLVVLIPFVEEPTQDLNVTFALAFFAVIFIHKKGYQADPEAYIHHWFKTPLSLSLYFKVPFLSHIELLLRAFINFIVALVLFPLELMGRLSLIFSLSFRLYGNIFGGSMISHLLKSFLELSWIYQVFGIVTGINMIVMIFFGCLEGLIQAFVFMLIAINNLGMFVAQNEQENKELKVNSAGV